MHNPSGQHKRFKTVTKKEVIVFFKNKGSHSLPKKERFNGLWNYFKVGKDTTKKKDDINYLLVHRGNLSVKLLYPYTITHQDLLWRDHKRFC